MDVERHASRPGGREAARRFVRSNPDLRRAQDFSGSFSKAHESYNEARGTWIEHENDIDLRFTWTIYNNGLFAFDYLDGMFQHTRMVESGENLLVTGRMKFNEDIQDHRNHDLFLRKKDSISLREIGGFSTPLDEEDIRAISNLFKGGRLRKPKPKDMTLIKSALLLATLPFVNPAHEGRTPVQLRRVQKVLIDYLDSFTEAFAMPEDTYESNTFVYEINVKIGRELLRGLGAYIPARLGISPSSAAKLAYEREEPGGMVGFNWRKLNKHLLKEFMVAYRESALPNDLMPYIHYDKESDEKASAILRSNYEKDSGNTKELRESSDNIRERIADNQRRIKRAIKVTGENQFTLNPDSIEGLNDVVVTSMYPQSIMFIARFSDGSHLTLEIDKQGSIYGVPPELFEQIPHIEDLLLRDIVQPVVDFVDPKEEEEKTSPRITLTHGEPISIQAKKPHKRKKRKNDVIVPRQPQIISEELPEIEGRVQPDKLVFFTVEQVVKELGKIARDRHSTKSCLRAIHNFEQGGQNFDSISDPNWPGRIRLKAGGNLRIILRNKGNGNYDLELVGDRKDIYRKMGI